MCIAALSGALALAGCSDGGGTTTPSDNADGIGDEALSASSPEVQAAVADGEASKDEYDAAYRRFIVCMEAGGTTILEYPMLEDIYQYGVPDEAVQSGLYDECYYREFYGVDLLWQIAHPTSLNLLATCLHEAGVDFVGTVEEMEARLIEIGEDPEECLANK